MADDTKGHGASGEDLADDRPDGGIVAGTPTSTTTASTPVPSARTEWTASDARGPLNEAPPVPVAHASPTDDDLPDEGEGLAAPVHRASSGEPRPVSSGLPNAPASSVAEQPRRSLLPMAAALLVGAAIGAGSAYLVYQTQPASTDGLDQKIAQLSGRVDTLDNRPDPREAIAALKASIATLDGKVAALQKSGSAAPVAGASETASQPTTAAFDAAPLQQKIAALQASIDAFQKQSTDTKALEAKVGDIQTSLDGLKTQSAEAGKQASGAQAGVEAIQGQQKGFEGRISAPALAVVADSLVQQIARGQSYGQQVDALTTLGADPARIAILRENASKGVPSAKALAAQFAPLAEPILATEHKAAPQAGFLDRLKSGLSGLVSVRSTSDTTGDGLDARVSRIEANLTHDDVTGAYETWNALPAEAKAKSDAWGALAKTSAEAIDAASALQQGAIASLGGRKS